jgi:hypothetical protein
VFSSPSQIKRAKPHRHRLTGTRLNRLLKTPVLYQSSIAFCDPRGMKRTTPNHPPKRAPHISPSFGEMWVGCIRRREPTGRLKETGLQGSCFVSGHDFSRAVSACKEDGLLAPATAWIRKKYEFSANCEAVPLRLFIRFGRRDPSPRRTRPDPRSSSCLLAVTCRPRPLFSRILFPRAFQLLVCFHLARCISWSPQFPINAGQPKMSFLCQRRILFQNQEPIPVFFGSL